MIKTLNEVAIEGTDLSTIKATIKAMYGKPGASPAALMVKNTAANAGGLALNPGLGRPLEERMATHSSIPAWRIPWTEEPGGLWPLGLQRAGHD